MRAIDIHHPKRVMGPKRPERPRARTFRPLVSGLIGLVIFIPILAVIYGETFGPVTTDVQIPTEFIVLPTDSLGDVARRLHAEGIISHEWAFHLAFSSISPLTRIRPGGYDVSPSMDLFTLATVLADSPYLVWVDVPAGLRREQTAALLARSLQWTDEEKQAWLDAATSSVLSEGVYFPDVYLIPTDQEPKIVAARMRSRLGEAVAPYSMQLTKRDATLEEVLTIASMIEREAAGPHDMNLISGIIWNRLERNMPLGIDATLQYIKGTEENWWPVPRSEDKFLESPFNTYFRVGLPVAPINSPGLDAIKAALYPEETTCLYYLHDYRRRIHCSATYRGHLSNIDRYLR